jgi:hypothetical protein
MLCAAGNALDDLDPLLGRWAAVADARGRALHLPEFVRQNLPAAYPGRKLANAFWHARDTQVGQVRDWLGSAALKEAVAEGFLRTSDPAGDRLGDGICRTTSAWPIVISPAPRASLPSGTRAPGPRPPRRGRGPVREAATDRTHGRRPRSELAPSRKYGT